MVLAAVLEFHPMGQGGVDGAVAVARHVDRLLDQLLVDVAVPGAVKGDLDVLERFGPLLVPIAFDVDL